jgi:DNA-binding MarR family transcriptional regulator
LAVPNSFELEKRLTYRVSKLYSALARNWRHVGDTHDLPLREWRVLAAVAEAEQLSASDLVESSPLDKASVSRAVATLTKRGLISSRRDPDDRRVRVLALTASGRRVYERVAPLSAERHGALLAVLTRSEQRTLEQLLDRLNSRAEELLAESSSEPSA